MKQHCKCNTTLYRNGIKMVVGTVRKGCMALKKGQSWVNLEEIKENARNNMNGV